MSRLRCPRCFRPADGFHVCPTLEPVRRDPIPVTPIRTADDMPLRRRGRPRIHPVGYRRPNRRTGNPPGTVLRDDDGRLSSRFSDAEMGAVRRLHGARVSWETIAALLHAEKRTVQFAFYHWRRKVAA